MTRKRKARSAGGRKPTAAGGNVFNIANCHTVQVGQTNISTVSGHEDAVSSFTAKSNNCDNEKCMLVLKNVLKDREKPMPVGQLEECITDILKRGDSKPFKELCDVPLQDYLLVHNDEFRVYREKGTMYVSLTEGTRNIIKQQSSGACSSDYSRDASESPDAASHEWCQVTKKNQKRQQVKHTKPLAREIVPRRTEESPEVKKLKELLAKKEDRDIMFVADHTEYTENPGKCMQDIVSMWNTPQRTKSYIVIGVEKRNETLHLNGTDKDFDITIYAAENLFSLDLFTMRPTYQIITVEYESKSFVILEIASSCGKGQPSIVTQSYEKDHVALKVNELWYREGSSNAVCPPTNLTIGSIYQWFSGTMPLILAEAVSAEVSFTESKSLVLTLSNRHISQLKSKCRK